MLGFRPKRKCAVCGIPPANAFSFHQFPKPGKFIERSRKWAQFAYPNENWESQDALMKLHKSGRGLCSAHFLPCDYSENISGHLLRYAYPRNLNLSQSLSSSSNHPSSSASSSSDPSDSTPSSSYESRSDGVASSLSYSAVAPSSVSASTSSLVLSPLSNEAVSSSFSSTSICLSKKPSSLVSSSPIIPCSSNVNIAFMNSTILSSSSDIPNLSSSVFQQLPSSPLSSTPLKKTSRRCILSDLNVTRFSHLTPRKQRLLSFSRYQTKKIISLKKTIAKKKQIVNLKQLSKNPHVTALSDRLSPAAYILLKSQIRSSNRKPRGRRWELDEKLLALTIFKKSPSCYRLLQKLFNLPAKSTLTNILSNFPLKPGISPEILSTLSNSPTLMNTLNRTCILMFDEMSIRSHVSYNPKYDCLDGFQDHGEDERTHDIASHALVFMVSGIRKKWKQPIAYYLSKSTTPPHIISFLLTTVIRSLSSIKLNVVAVVSDMGTNNTAALDNLRNDLQDCFFELDGQKISTIYDAPHLLKCTRNMFMKHNVQCSIDVDIRTGNKISGIARWDHIKQLFEDDQRRGYCKMVPKLTENHLNPKFGKKMKVKLAAQTMSHSVGAALLSYSSRDEIKNATASASFVMEVDNIFDSLNGRKSNIEDGKILKTKLNDKSKHLHFWQEAKNNINNWQFLDVNGKKLPTPPSQRGWITTICGVEHVWQTVKTLGFEYLEPRSLNQDPLENLFGMVRYFCGGNPNPTVKQFVGAFKTAIINGLPFQDSKGTNCEEDNIPILNSLRHLISSDSSFQVNRSDNLVRFETICSEVREQLNVQKSKTRHNVSRGSIESLSLAYVSGFIVRKLFTKLDCNSCRNILTSDPTDVYNEFVNYKEYDNTERLCYASENMIVSIGDCINIIESYLDVNKHRYNLKTNMLSILKEYVDFSWLKSCKVHFTGNIDSILLHIFYIWINEYCLKINKKIKSDKNWQRRKLHILNNS